MESMEKSDKTQSYYEKLSVIFLETVPKYLRQYFITHWNAKFPQEPWKSGSQSGSYLLNAIPEEKKNHKKLLEYRGKLQYGNENDWDTITLGYVMLDFGLNICDNSVKEDIVKLRKATSQFASCKSSKSCSPAQSEQMIADITAAAKKLFQKDAEAEISKRWHSKNETSQTNELCKQIKELEFSKELKKVLESGKLLFQYSVPLRRNESPLIFVTQRGSVPLLPTRADF